MINEESTPDTHKGVCAQPPAILLCTDSICNFSYIQ